MLIQMEDLCQERGQCLVGTLDRTRCLLLCKDMCKTGRLIKFNKISKTFNCPPELSRMVYRIWEEGQDNHNSIL